MKYNVFSIQHGSLDLNVLLECVFVHFFKRLACLVDVNSQNTLQNFRMLDGKRLSRPAMCHNILKACIPLWNVQCYKQGVYCYSDLCVYLTN